MAIGPHRGERARSLGRQIDPAGHPPAKRNAERPRAAVVSFRRNRMRESMFNRHGRDVGRSIRSHSAAFAWVRPASPVTPPTTFLQAQSTARGAAERL